MPWWNIFNGFKVIARKSFNVRIAVIISVMTLVLVTIAATNKRSVVMMLSGRNWLKTSTRNNNEYTDSTVYVEDHREAVDYATIKAASAFDDTPYKNKFEPADLMHEGPFSFLPNYKNPCFTDRVGLSNITCMPYVFLAGFPKCGTTDMYVRLTRHTDIAKPRTKEPHWLTKTRFSYKSFRTLRSYLRTYFGEAAIEMYNSADREGYHKKITGDFSASTIFYNMRWRSVPGNQNRSEPLYTNADYIHSINPNVKIMVMVREPIDREYSDFLYFNRNVTAETFHIAVTGFIAEWNACLKIRTLRNCLNSHHEIIPNAKVRPRIGMYSEHIAEFLRVFPRDQLLVIKMEEYSTDPATAMHRVFDFLNITRISTDEMGEIADADIHKNRNSKHSDKIPMLNETRRVLAGLYKPYNDKLAGLLGDDKFNYNSRS